VSTAGVAATDAEPLVPPWLEEVRLRAQRRMLWCREAWVRSRYAGEDALAITHSEVERALATPDAAWRAERGFYAEDPAAAALTTAIDTLAQNGDDARWRRLVALCELTADEGALLACALAAEWAPALRRVFGYLEDDAVPLDATPALVGALWQLAAPPRIGAASGLVRWRLARPADPARATESSSMPWVADPCLLDHLLGDKAPSGPATRLAVPVTAPSDAVLFEPELETITRYASALTGALAGAVEIEITGPAGVGKTTLAAQAAAGLNASLVAVAGEAIAVADDPTTAAIHELRDARLSGNLLLWRHADRLPAAARATVSGRAPLSLLTAAAPLSEGPEHGSLRLTVELAPLDRDRRLRLWSKIGQGPPPPAVAEWRLHPGELRAAAHAARAGEDAVRAVCRRALMATPSDLVTRLPLPYGWGDLVAPESLLAHLREFESQCRDRGQVLDEWGLRRLVPLGRGVSALFAGPSGTGKTMAAQVLARELGLELLRVDLAGVVNKYIGETEKHLRAVFAACERAPVMLFFDEADALFGRRMQVSDAHDRFANIEVDYLLQRMEEFDGVAVLATNRKGDIDSAFLRRLRFVIEFAPPTEAERERLWRLALEPARDAAGQALADALDWRALARELDLNGAGIKASALAAAFMARTDGGRIAARHVVAAARRELHKQGIVVRIGDLDLAALGVASDRRLNRESTPPHAECAVIGGNR
jgi:AAA+ superfamily predicted ATPase